MNAVWILVGVALLVAFKVWQGSRSAEQIATMKRAVTGGAPLIDVRSAGEFQSGHLPGAVNVPLPSLASDVGRHVKSGGTVVLYCASGARSAMGARTLRAKGYEVHDAGRMSNWGKG